MESRLNPTRREFLVSSAASGIALVTVSSAGCQASGDRQLQFASLTAASEELARLAQAKGLDSSAAWSWAQTLEHCAQSIEYSLSGFPQPRSPLFQRTAGSAAYGFFAWRGRMSHDLAEPIPGAPVLAASDDSAIALARLRAAILRFEQWTGPLQPHFAYGALDKREYGLAHAMHLGNHFSAFRAKA
ncbi:MAG: DUF1569 domain-containing protein [Pseudomonadota bacterium]